MRDCAITARDGDGRTLGEYRVTEFFSRTLFFAEIPEATKLHEYAVDVHYYADELETGGQQDVSAEAPAALYRDGVQILRSDIPSVFPVPGGVIEVATSMYGLRRMHYVPDEGTPLPLRPHQRSPEGIRAGFARSFPRMSAVFGRVAVIVMIVGVIAAVPQTIETVSRLDLIADQFGVFTSPLRLPDWLNSMLAVATVVACVERALTLRSHRLADTVRDLAEGE